MEIDYSAEDNFLPKKERSGRKRQVKGTKVNISDKTRRTVRCIAITTTGTKCKRMTTRGQYCDKHNKSIGDRGLNKHTSVYGKYAISLADTMREMQEISVEMKDEVVLLRAILTSVLLKYEEGTATYHDVVAVTEQLRKVLEYQAKFLPARRPIDEEAVSSVVTKITDIIIDEVQDEKTVRTLVMKLSNSLTTVATEEKKRAIMFSNQSTEVRKKEQALGFYRDNTKEER